MAGRLQAVLATLVFAGVVAGLASGASGAGQFPLFGPYGGALRRVARRSPTQRSGAARKGGSFLVNAGSVHRQVGLGGVVEQDADESLGPVQTAPGGSPARGRSWGL